MNQETPPSSIPPARDNTQSEVASEKDQYSLEEMMKTLRDKEREKEEQGEVVTRSDGSVARKVKRRRRRTDQPEKASPEKEKKNLLFKVIVAVCLGLALFLTGLFLLLSHNSKGHREDLEQIASDWTGADVDLNGFKRLPLSVKIQGANFDWPATSYLRELEIRGIEGDATMSSFVGARPGGLQIGGATGKLVTGMPTASGEVGQSFEEEDFPFTYDQYYCQALGVAFGDSEQIALQGVSASLRHIPNEGGQITLDQGTLLLDGWKPFPISSGLMRFDENGIDLKSLSLDQPQGDDSMITSSLKISGLIPLGPGEKVHLKTETEHFSFSSLIGEKLSRFFSGAVTESSGDILYTMGEDQIDEILMEFKAERVRILAFPFLANMAELFPDRQLEELNFDSGLAGSAITGVLRVRPEGVAIEKLEMARKGNLQFKGGVVISKAGKIAGKVELWINRVFLSGNPQLASSPLMKGSENTGFVKVSFRLGGTIAQPEDTFRSEIGMEAALPGFTNDPNIGDEDLWDELGKPADELMPKILRDDSE